MRSSNERSILASILTRISVDAATIDLRHVFLDDQGRYSDDVDSGLNRCLTFEANIDQGPRDLKQDIVMTMLDTNCAVIVPVDVVRDAMTKQILDIHTLRVGTVVTWYPRHVKVSLYNEATGKRQEIMVEKRMVAIPSNPLFPVMNGPNSTLSRLIRKLNLLDVIDEKAASGQLDLIIQVPYTVRSENQKQRAEDRRRAIEDQLASGSHGIAYTDSTEKVIQLNRPVENNLLGQIEFLTKLLYSQLGITEGVMDGSADEKALLNYYDRTIEPIVTSITESMQRAFLGVPGLLAKERVRYYKNPFKLVPISQLAEIADKLTRNEIVSSNEVREMIGMKPSKDPKADQLVNSNMPVRLRGGDPTEKSEPQAASDTPKELTETEQRIQHARDEVVSRAIVARGEAAVQLVGNRPSV